MEIFGLVRHASIALGVGMMRYLVEIRAELFQPHEGEIFPRRTVRRLPRLSTLLPYKFRPAHAGARCLYVDDVELRIAETYHYSIALFSPVREAVFQLISSLENRCGWCTDCTGLSDHREAGNNRPDGLFCPFEKLKRYLPYQSKRRYWISGEAILAGLAASRFSRRSDAVSTPEFAPDFDVRE